MSTRRLDRAAVGTSKVIRLPKSMLTKCAVCGSYDVEFYETLDAQHYCDGCLREQPWYEMCLYTRFNTAGDVWCDKGYWLASPEYD